MKSKYLRVVLIFVLIISLLYFLVNCLTIYIKGFIRECDRIKITDNNREKIVSLMEETIASLIEETEAALMDADYYKKIPNINRAKEIESYATLHNYNITVYYEDGTTYSFFIRGYYGEPLILLIQNEGYNVYFRSSEFVADLIKTIISLILVVFVVVLMKKHNYRDNANLSS